MQPTSKRALLILFLTVFIDLLGFGIVLPLLPRYGEQLDADGFTLGLLMASFSAMQFLFAPIWGRLSDRFGRRPILLIGLAGSVVFYALFGFASMYASLTWMFLSRIGAGIAGATISTAQAYIADSTTPDRRTAGMALIGAAFGIGFTFGPLLGALALTFSETSGSLSPAVGFLASGLSAVALLMAFFMLPESLTPEARPADRHWFDVDSFRLALATPAVGSLILVFFVATIGFAMFESTLALLSKHAFEMSNKGNLYLFAYVGLVLTLTQGVLIRRLSKRLADETLARIGLVTMIVGMAGMVVVCRTQSWPLLLVVLALLVVGYAFTTPSVQAMISRRSRSDQQGGILGANQSGSAMARILGPVVGMVLFGEHGATMTYPYWLGAGLSAATLVVLLRVRAGGDADPR